AFPQGLVWLFCSRRATIRAYNSPPCSTAKLAPGSIHPSPRPLPPVDFAVRSIAMSMHRMKCRNSQCAFEGMMEAKSDRQFVKKSFLDKAKADAKAKGIAPTPE